MITQAKLKELLHYNPGTGIFTWLVRKSDRIKVGDTAGSPNSDGYIKIKIDGCPYGSARLAWLYMTGEWPTDKIDHKNSIVDDNRWHNLREVTHSVNLQNQRKANKDSKTGFLGVTRHGNSFQAQIVINKKLHHLGTYATPELAHEAYLKAKRKLHAGCTI